jgi:hypothetical protein
VTAAVSATPRSPQELQDHRGAVAAALRRRASSKGTRSKIMTKAGTGVLICSYRLVRP